MSKLSLNQEQVNAYENMEVRQKYLQAANSSLINALQEMTDDRESVIFQVQDVYPELWESMINMTINVTREFESILQKKIKDIIRSHVLNEAKNPILPEEERETSDDSLCTIPTIFKIRETKGDSDLFEDIWKALVKNNECGVYSDLDSATHNKIWDIIKKYYEAEELPRGKYMDLVREISQVSNQFVAMDIIWNIFKCPYDIFPSIALNKYSYVNDVITSEKQESLEEVAEVTSEEDEEEDVEVYND